MAIIGELTDYAKNTSGIRDYINGQYEHEGKDGEEVGIGGFTAFAQISEKFKRSASVPVTYLENGTHVNDPHHSRAKTISIEGNVSDLFVAAKRTGLDIAGSSSADRKYHAVCTRQNSSTVKPCFRFGQ